jgi:hypothetical protein
MPAMGAMTNGDDNETLPIFMGFGLRASGSGLRTLSSIAVGSGSL